MADGRAVISGLDYAKGIVDCMVKGGVLQAAAMDQSRFESAGNTAKMPGVAVTQKNGKDSVDIFVTLTPISDLSLVSSVQQLLHVDVPEGKNSTAEACMTSAKPARSR